MAEGLVSHYGTQVGAADTDIDDVLDALAGMPLPFTRADAVCEGTHGLEDLVDFGNDIDAVDLDHLAFGGTEGHMKNGAVLGDVDLFPGEHLVAVLLETDFLGKLDEVLERRVINAVLGIVEIESAGLRGQALAARRIGGEEFLQRRLCDLVTIGGKGFPGGELGGVGHGKKDG